MNAVLALADGTIFRGTGFGAAMQVTGEVVFNTSLVGYEESLTDPSYAGQILTLTYPLIGNYGVRSGDFESERVQVAGFVVRELCSHYSHRNAVKSLDAFLREFNVPGIAGIDTRMLARKIREEGVINGALMVSEDAIHGQGVIARAKSAADYSSKNFLAKVSVDAPKFHDAKGDKSICMIDTGVKLSIIRNFLKREVSVWRMPYNATAEEIRMKKPDGIFLANGPGDPEQAKEAIATVKALHKEYPISGICLGNQIIGLALGAKTYKLKFGHRGINQPVKELARNKVFITSQNHGFAIEEKSLGGTGLVVTHVNLNDGSVEGMRHKELPIRSVQMHPEANPGPNDIEDIFDVFIGDLH
ncbi:TPA: glutamine-hydrolyzing carbamoyl-phosphate synthase small subunit [Candidatus Woesearchaeota archaeon]|nr:glutamine-hydrolyzing carbamoyl-phosphate synthase small subunit [Candidatus Woesearchaeota archaeon]